MDKNLAQAMTGLSDETLFDQEREDESDLFENLGELDEVDSAEFEVVEPQSKISEFIQATPLMRAPGAGANRVQLKGEKPWHRMAAAMLAMNMTQGQVATALGKTKAAVNLLFAQPWFQSMILVAMAKSETLNLAHTIIKDGAAAAAMTMVNFANGHTKVPAAVQFQAAKAILDRAIGLPGKEKIEAHENIDEFDNELAELETQVQELKLQENRL